MKKLLALLGVSGLLLAGVPGATQAGPTPGGYASDNVEHVGYVPFEVGTATGLNFLDKKHFVVTSWKNFSIYDASDPESPQRLSTVPFGFKFENEDVATNGKIMLFSEELPTEDLHIYDVEDKSNPQFLATVTDGGGHTSECLLNCKWSYSTLGDIVDLRNPAKPKLMKQNWMELLGVADAHEMEEYKPGFIIISAWKEQASVIADVRNPLKPKLVGTIPYPGEGAWGMHSGRWPRAGKDALMFMQGEQNAKPRCSDQNGPFLSYSTKSFKKTRTMKLIDTYHVTNGTYNDGAPPVNGLGCSAHWFEEHPKFKNGGLVAVGYYEHGTRIVDVARNGKMKEAGWFVPWGGSTSSAQWVTNDIIYAVDYTRGIDILKFKAKK